MIIVFMLTSDLIKASLRLLGISNPGPEDLATGLEALNLHIQSINTEHSLVYSIVTNTLTSTLGQSYIDISAIDDDILSVCLEDGEPVTLLSRHQWPSYQSSSTISNRPSVVYDDGLGKLHLYPELSEVATLYVAYRKTYDDITSLQTELLFPHGWERYLKFILACIIAPEYGLDPSPVVKSKADAGKVLVKRTVEAGGVSSVAAYTTTSTSMSYLPAPTFEVVSSITSDFSELPAGTPKISATLYEQPTTLGIFKGDYFDILLRVDNAPENLSMDYDRLVDTWSGIGGSYFKIIGIEPYSAPLAPDNLYVFRMAVKSTFDGLINTSYWVYLNIFLVDDDGVYTGSDVLRVNLEVTFAGV